MITVTLKQHDPTRYLRLTVEGHADSGEVGHDLVCASSSILAYTAAQIIHTMDKHGDLNGDPLIELENGMGIVSCRCKTDAIYAEAAHALFVVQVGYQLLEHNYPQNVKIITDGKTERS